MNDFVDVIPLGGFGEFGMNCAAVRYGSDIVLIDAGMAFPRGERGLDLGVEVIVPDLSFIQEHHDQIRALILTHGHEDHVGAVSFLLEALDVPIYGSALTLGLVEARLRERKLAHLAQLHTIRSREILEFGPLRIEPLHVTHSFPDSFCLAINTPIGSLIWSGDFKFDPTPIDGRITDLHRLAAYGEKGVLVLFADSTNSLRSGLAPSEFSVCEPLRDLFRRSSRRIIASTFSSGIHRIQILLDLAREFDRQVVPVGRSMVNNIRTARELGYLSAPPDLLITPGEAGGIPAEKLLVLASGSQGEPMSALSRLAVDQIKGLQVEEEDTVILSTRIIPGNEMPIARLINHFFRRGARVYDSGHSLVHVSGHGYRDDVKLLINLVRPQFFVPIHGEYRQLKSNFWIAQDQGLSADSCAIIENGDVLRITPLSMEVADKVPVGRRFIDEGALEEVHENVLRERRYLSEDGFVMVILQLDRSTGELMEEPEIVSRTPLEQKQDEDIFNEILRKELRRLLRKRTGKRPVILSLTFEI
ncbi:MAG: ribonuclease J [Acidobacteriota bacterium]